MSFLFTHSLLPFKEIMMYNLQGAEEQKTQKLPRLEKAEDLF